MRAPGGARYPPARHGARSAPATPPARRCPPPPRRAPLPRRAVRSSPARREHQPGQRGAHRVGEVERRVHRRRRHHRRTPCRVHQHGLDHRRQRQAGGADREGGDGASRRECIAGTAASNATACASRTTITAAVAVHPVGEAAAEERPRGHAQPQHRQQHRDHSQGPRDHLLRHRREVGGEREQAPAAEHQGSRTRTAPAACGTRPARPGCPGTRCHRRPHAARTAPSPRRRAGRPLRSGRTPAASRRHRPAPSRRARPRGWRRWRPRNSRPTADGRRPGR